MQPGEEVVYLYLDDIIPNRFQPREVFDERPLKELAVSIKEHGVIQPIIVRKVNDKYEIIAGERRYKASALAGLTKIPAIIRELDDKESSKVALLENLQRKNLNPIEEAKTYQKILEIDEMTQEDLAKTMGKSQSSVANKLRLLSLSDEIQQALLQDKISERHARTLLNVKDQKEQQRLLNEILDNKMTVRQLEEKIKEEESQEENIIPDTSVSNSSLDSIKKVEIKPVLGQDNYIASNPLIPEFSTSDDSDKKEPLLITPSGENLMDSKEEPELLINTEQEFQEEENTQKFINFGEIDEENNEIENDNMYLGNSLLSEESSNDFNELKQDSQNISIPKQEASNADLDSLLRINTDSTNVNSFNENSTDKPDFKFFSPVQEALKESEQDDTTLSDDYFEAPDLNNIDIPSEVSSLPTNNISLSQAHDDSNKNQPSIQESGLDQKKLLQDSILLIRDTIQRIEEKGLKIESDDMNLENSYQVIIKIEK